MNTPWLKSLIFWSLLVGSLIFIFQCTQKSEHNKVAPALMYERLYHCTSELSSEHALLIKKIQNEVHVESSQQTMMELMSLCRKANPLKSKAEYVHLLKKL
ncbi:hypothetical protein [Acinetobacter sp. YH12239]|uniref:hypothetical protein n=1 Tax=Acinetobacter sp. YH12239 TaxID=2601166 RepID=UPI0015D3BB25|nr:hypothetical protein [Acinetobacter sp. YH12239]